MNRLQWIKLLIKDEINELKWTHYYKHPEKYEDKFIIVEETEESNE